MKKHQDDCRFDSLRSSGTNPGMDSAQQAPTSADAPDSVVSRKSLHRRMGIAATLVIGIATLAAAGPARAQSLGTTFTYQGRLVLNDEPVDETCDFDFGLWDSDTDGTQLGTTQETTIDVQSGLFTVRLNENGDFGSSAFNGDRRWLEVAVCCPSGCAPQGLVTLDPRQELTTAPYAQFSDNTRGVSVDPNGDVGIGTSSPQEQLHVNGNVRVDGTVTTNGRTRRIWIPVTDFLFADSVGTSIKNISGDSTGWYIVTRVSGVGGLENYRYFNFQVRLPDDLKNNTVTIGLVMMGTNAEPDVDVDLKGWVSAHGAGEDASAPPSNVSGWGTMVADFELNNDTITEVENTYIHPDLVPGSYVIVRAELFDLTFDADILGAYFEYTGE